MRALIVTLACTAAAAFIALPGARSVHARAAAEGSAVDKARAYTEGVLLPALAALPKLTDELHAANAERAGWAPYTDGWKSWTAAEAEGHRPSFAHAEYLWSVQKDAAFRRRHLETAAAEKLKELVAASGGAIGELFVTDARGGNVCQTAESTDWFQGDEPKFTRVAGSRRPYYPEPKRDASAGKTGVQVSVPLWGTVDGKEQFIGVAVALVITDGLK